MARGGLSATRATEIIDFLASRGTTPFTLSELSRELDINVASLHAILLALTKTGHLARHPVHKTFTLGPALVAIGHVALRNHEIIARAETAAEELSREEELEVLLTMRAGDSVLGLSHFGHRRVSKSPLRAGQRLPLRLPYGATLVAWEGEEEIERWIAGGLPAQADSAGAEQFRRLLATIRQRGYQIALQRDAKSDLIALSQDWAADSYLHQAKVRMRQIEENFELLFFDPLASADEARHAVEFMTAPLFDLHNRAHYAMTFYNFGGPLTSAEIRAFLAKLLAMTAAIRREL